MLQCACVICRSRYQYNLPMPILTRKRNIGLIPITDPIIGASLRRMLRRQRPKCYIPSTRSKHCVCTICIFDDYNNHYVVITCVFQSLQTCCTVQLLHRTWTPQESPERWHSQAGEHWGTWSNNQGACPPFGGVPEKIISTESTVVDCESGTKSAWGLQIEQRNIATCILRITRSCMLTCSHCTWIAASNKVTLHRTHIRTDGMVGSAPDSRRGCDLK